MYLDEFGLVRGIGLGSIGEDVSKLVVRAHPLHSDRSCLDLLANEVMADVDVLGSLVVGVVPRHIDGTLVVAEHAPGGRRPGQVAGKCLADAKTAAMTLFYRQATGLEPATQMIQLTKIDIPERPS